MCILSIGQRAWDDTRHLVSGRLTFKRRPSLADRPGVWFEREVSALALPLICLAYLGAGPVFDINGLDIEGVIQRPTAFTVVTPPKEIGLHDAPSSDALRAAEARIARGPVSAADLTIRARARAAEARARLDAAWRAWDEQRVCADAGTCPDPGEPPVPDYRPALLTLAEAEGAADAADPGLVGAGRRDRLALAAALALEPGPGYDPARGMVALDEVTHLVTRGPVAIWAHMLMGEHAFEHADMRAALAHYQAGAKAEAGSALVPFLRYKSAWAYFNLGDADAAIALLRALVEGDAAGPLAREAVRDLVVMYTHRPERIDEAVGVLSARDEGPRLLLALAEQLSDLADRGAAGKVLAAIGEGQLGRDDLDRLRRLRAWLSPGPDRAPYDR